MTGPAIAPALFTRHITITAPDGTVLEDKQTCCGCFRDEPRSRK